MVHLSWGGCSSDVLGMGLGEIKEQLHFFAGRMPKKRESQGMNVEEREESSNGGKCGLDRREEGRGWGIDGRIFENKAAQCSALSNQLHSNPAHCSYSLSLS